MMHTPLFPPGLHALSETQLDNHFLHDFSASQTRPSLIAGLREFLALLKTTGIPFEVWLDGSFCTDKVDPNDVDLVVFPDPQHVNGLSEPIQRSLDAILDRATARATFGCDVYFCPGDNANVRSYWRGWYGFDRNEQAKGIAQLFVTP